jgi:hypothetical protein
MTLISGSFRVATDISARWVNLAHRAIDVNGW